jgi:hypothetical protein
VPDDTPVPAQDPAPDGGIPDAALHEADLVDAGNDASATDGLATDGFATDRFATDGGDVEGTDGPEPASPYVVPTTLAHVLLFVVGVVTALFGVALAPVRVGGALAPVGLAVVVVIPVIARAAAWLTGRRLGAGLVAVGWAVPTIAFVLAGPGGDVLLPDVTRTWVYLLATTALLVLAIAVPLPRGARELAEARRAGRPDPAPASPADPAP